MKVFVLNKYMYWFCGLEILLVLLNLNSYLYKRVFGLGIMFLFLNNLFLVFEICSNSIFMVCLDVNIEF